MHKNYNHISKNFAKKKSKDTTNRYLGTVKYIANNERNHRKK